MIKPIYKYFEKIDSTNLEAKREGDNGAAGFTVISAGTQTAGKGRSGHTWISIVPWCSSSNAVDVMTTSCSVVDTATRNRLEQEHALTVT